MKKTAAVILLACSVVTLFASCRSEGNADAEPSEVIDIDIADPTEIVCIDNPSSIRINELMADNSDFVMGCADDWVELYNDDETDVSLASYSLAKMGNGSVFKLDEYTIPAKGYVVIRLDEEAPFRLAKEGDSVALKFGDEIIDELSFDAEIVRSSYSHDGVCEHPTPGFSNDEAGYSAYIDTVELPGLRINEVVSSNSRYIPDDNEYYDFVEIFNGSEEAADLSEYCLSDKRSELGRYSFPSVSLLPGEYFVVYCSGKEGGENHAPFKISSSGEAVYLSRGGVIVDSVYVPSDLPKDESYGRMGKLFVYMSEVTPAAPNSDGVARIVDAPLASVPTGAYDEAFSVELSGSGEIHYTLDGTVPTQESPTYTEPIQVDGIVSIRAVCVDEGRRGVEASYFYTVGIKHVYPVVNVAIKQEYLTGDEGVLNNIEPEYEHECFVTMMDDGVECFCAPCGFKLHGNDSKKVEKQNFQLRFRSAYGMSKLEYKVFDNRDITTFNSLLLKGGSEDYLYCGFRDELATSLVDGTTNLSVQAYRPVILYLNGEYHGFYWLRERFDSEYCAQRLGVSEDSINIVKEYGNLVAEGSNEKLTELIEFCKTNDLTVRENYEHVLNCIDYVGIMDWYICRSYMGDVDLANIRFYSSDEDDGKWHWCYYDLDWAFWNNYEDPIGKTVRDDGNHAIILALLKNPEFKQMFLDRYAELMGSVLNEEHILAKIDEFAEIMRPEMEADRAKYNLTVSGWESEIERLKDYFRNGSRDKTVLNGIRQYFNLSDDEMMNCFGRTA
ncbi:MAG: CotH kinase family protein [Clostridia bacterium]|nr:CotH kinase family protein [Clostridia bacterium]